MMRSVVLTREGRAELESRLERMREELTAYAPLLGDGDRDERHVRDYERLLGQVVELQAQLALASPLPESRSTDAVHPGCRVRLTMEDGEVIIVRPVDPLEAPLDDERISWDSPLGRVLVGAELGSTVTVHSPRGDWICTVTSIDAPT